MTGDIKIQADNLHLDQELTEGALHLRGGRWPHHFFVYFTARDGAYADHLALDLGQEIERAAPPPEVTDDKVGIK